MQASVIVAHMLSCPVASSWTRDQTCVPCLSRRIRNHWTAREVRILFLIINSSLYNWHVVCGWVGWWGEVKWWCRGSSRIVQNNRFPRASDLSHMRLEEASREGSEARELWNSSVLRLAVEWSWRFAILECFLKAGITLGEWGPYGQRLLLRACES